MNFIGFKSTVALLCITLVHSANAFDMVRDSNAKEFTRKVDHKKDDSHPVRQLQMKRPANYPTDIKK